MFQFYEAIKTQDQDCRLVFVDADREIAYVRTQQRDVSSHRPFDRTYFDQIYDACQKRKAMADVVLLNNGAIDDFFTAVERIRLRSEK